LFIPVNGLHSYLQKQSESALAQLHAFQQTADAEAMHQFRVSLKKIHAGVVYLQSRFPRIKKQKKRIKTVFRAGGLIREQQLRLQWLRRHRLHLLAATAGLEGKLVLHQDQFTSELPASKKELKKAFSNLLADAEMVRKQELLHYVVDLKASVLLLLQKSHAEDWHELRKQIKQLLYAVHWLEPEEQLRLLRITQLKYLDKLQEAIGAWHDLVDLKQWLTDELFFLHEHPNVRKAFGRCWNEVQQLLTQQQKTVSQLLQQHRFRLMLT
jgi:CHAD domain-containing protein